LFLNKQIALAKNGWEAGGLTTGLAGAFVFIGPHCLRGDARFQENPSLRDNPCGFLRWQPVFSLGMQDDIFAKSFSAKKYV